LHKRVTHSLFQTTEQKETKDAGSTIANYGRKKQKHRLSRYELLDVYSQDVV